VNRLRAEFGSDGFEVTVPKPMVAIMGMTREFDPTGHAVLTRPGVAIRQGRVNLHYVLDLISDLPDR
jgi:hypothetical protein